MAHGRADRFTEEIPQSGGTIFTARQQVLAIRAEGHRFHHSIVADRRGEQFAVADRPKPDGSIGAQAGERPPVRTESRLAERLLLAQGRAGRFARRRGPKPRRLIQAARGNPPAVRAVACAADVGLVPALLLGFTLRAQPLLRLLGAGFLSLLLFRNRDLFRLRRAKRLP